MMSDRLLPCRVLLVWSLIVALILPVPLGGCVARKQDGVGFVSGASSDRAASASRADVAAVGPEKDADRAGDADRERPRGLDAALFNVAATFMGLPGLAPSTGARDEGLGYHQDGTARRAGSADAFDGRQARAYMGAGLMGDGAFSSPDGTLLPRRLGDEYSGRRRDYASRGFENFNLMDMALDRGLNYGMGMLNSAGEAALSGLVDNGRARLNFQLDRDGRFSGEGDVLLPFWDAPQHTLFTQIGARSMDVSGGEEDGSQRWIGNFGLGHRWFPFAESMEEAGNLMLGWNVFFDNDFSRSHQRGGAGLEAQYDWFHLAANYYTPLSGWKNSRDFDGDFVEERPARGWDARAKAYLPFYRNVALTGSFSQWYGDNVAMYGSSDDLEKDPRVWSYGVEYTPIPLLSAFARQRSTERGKADTEFGLQFTWHFDMPWEEQTSHAKVAELRTVSGSRHEFVDRENRIILEYRAKNAGRIEYLGPVSGQTNAFLFRVTDGFGRAWAGKTVWVRADNVTLAVAPQPSRSLLALAGDVLGGLFGAREAHAATASHSYVTDSQGCFTVRVTSPVAGPVTLHVRAGENEQSFTVNVVANATLKMSASSAALTQGTTQRVTFTFTRNGVAQSGLEVRFAANAAFRELAQGAVTDKTGSDGRVTLELTALTNDTSQTICMETDGQTLTQSFTVTPGKYALTAEPGSLSQHRETEITFTLTQGGIPVPQGTKITLSGTGVTFDGKAQYTCVTEDASGAITAKVIVSRTDASITATVDGGATATVKLQVTAAKYSLEASPSTLTQHKEQKVVFTLKANSQPLPNAKVTFTRNDNFSGLPEGEQTTDKKGQIVVTALTATASGILSIEAAVNGETVSASLTVGAAKYSLEASPGTLTQHKAEKVVFTLKANSQPLPNAKVTFKDNSGFNGLPATEQMTDKNGQITVTALTATAFGTLFIEAAVDGEIVSASFTVNAATYSLEASPSTLTQHKEQKVVFTLKANSQPLPNAKVTFTRNDNFSGLPEGEQTTDKKGQIVVTALTATASGILSIEAAVNGETVSASLTVGAAKYSLEASPGTLTQHKAEKVVFTLKANSQPLPNAKVTFKDNSGFNGLPATEQMTDKNGQITVTALTATAFGTLFIEAAVDGEIVSASFTVNAATYSLEASPSTLTQHKEQKVVFTLKANSQPLPNAKVTFTRNDNFSGLPEGEQTTDKKGQIVVTALTATAFGTLFIEAAVDGEIVSASFTVNAATYSLEASPSTLTQHKEQKVVFTLKANSQPLPNAKVTFTRNDNFSGLPEGEQTTDKKGQIVVTALTATASGILSIEAAVNGETVSASLTVGAAKYSLEASPGTLTQHKAEKVVFTLKANSQPLPNAKVTFKDNSGFNGLPATEQMTDKNGQITVTALTATAFGTLFIEAAVDGEIVSASFTVNAATYSLEASPSTLTQHKEQKVVFTLKANSQPLPNAKVTFTRNDNFSGLPEGEQTTDKKGQIVVTALTATASGILSIEAAVNGETVSASLTVGAAKYSLEASPGTLTQHKAEKVVFTLKANSQPLPNAKVTFKDNSGFNGLPATEQMTDKNGQITVTALTATAFGTLFIEAAVDGEIVSASFTVNAATYSLEASPNTLTLGVETEVTFTLQANGNPLGDTAVTLSGENLTFSPTGATTDKDGKFTVKLTATGTSTAMRTITATVGTDTVTVDLRVGKATFGLTTSGDTAFDKNKQTITLTAELTDANGTKITLNDGDVKWSVISSKVTSEAWMRSAGAYNGLTWGTTAQSATPNEGEKTEKPDGTAPTGAEAYLTDIVGERKVTVKASVEYNGQTYEATETVKFGEGPLAVFQKPLSNMSWEEAVKKCGRYYPPSQTGYQPATNLPRKEELQAVSGPGNGGYGAAFAAKWPDDRGGNGWFGYWTGELNASVVAKVVHLDNGLVIGFHLVDDVLVAVCRR